MAEEITRSIKHRVSMGNYEWIEYGASVTILLDGERAYEDALDEAEAALAHASESDLKAAAELTAERDSFVHVHPLVDQTPNTEQTNKKGRH